jgi:phosphatidate cytidylyltransferase
MLAKRIITAVIGIIAAIFIVNYGQWVFAAAALALGILAWRELTAMLCGRDLRPAFWLGLAGIGLLWGTAWLGNPRETVAVVLLVTLLALVMMVFKHGTFTLPNAACTVAGTLYVGLAFAHVVLLRFVDQTPVTATGLGTMPAGAAYLWLAFVGTWASDTFAFFVGSQFGRRKLAPAVSPGKTIEGAAGGLAGSILAVTGMGYLCHFHLGHSAAIGLLVGVVAPLGDLVESSLKRYCCVKDSGCLLPGHGGVLDRFDSIMFAVPAVYYYLQVFSIH